MFAMHTLYLSLIMGHVYTFHPVQGVCRFAMLSLMDGIVILRTLTCVWCVCVWCVCGVCVVCVTA